MIYIKPYRLFEMIIIWFLLLHLFELVFNLSSQLGHQFFFEP